MFSLLNISFQRLAVKLAPLSDDTTEGRPYAAAHWCKKAVAASDDEASFKGIASA